MIVYEFPLPDASEVERVLMGVISASPQASQLTESLTAELKDQLIKAALGLSLDQVARAFRSALIGRTTVDSSLIDALIDEKGQLTRKSGILNFVRNIPTIEEIGGLENLKDWLRKRARVLSSDGKVLWPSASQRSVDYRALRLRKKPLRKGHGLLLGGPPAPSRYGKAL